MQEHCTSLDLVRLIISTWPAGANKQTCTMRALLTLSALLFLSDHPQASNPAHQSYLWIWPQMPPHHWQQCAQICVGYLPACVYVYFLFHLEEGWSSTCLLARLLLGLNPRPLQFCLHPHHHRLQSRRHMQSKANKWHGIQTARRILLMEPGTTITYKLYLATNFSVDWNTLQTWCPLHLVVIVLPVYEYMISEKIQKRSWSACLDCLFWGIGKRRLARKDNHEIIHDILQCTVSQFVRWTDTHLLLNLMLFLPSGRQANYCHSDLVLCQMYSKAMPDLLIAHVCEPLRIHANICIRRELEAEKLMLTAMATLHTSCLYLTSV